VQPDHGGHASRPSDRVDQPSAASDPVDGAFVPSDRVDPSAASDPLDGAFAPSGRVDRPRVAISSCLLGVPVRYDGGHRRSAFLAEELGPRVEWVRLCPEVEIGLGTPRDPIELYETVDPARPRLLQGERDLSERMRGYALGRIAELRRQGIDGYILKARSPSCGLRDVNLVRRGGAVERAGTGIFARALREFWPELPAFDEDDLEDPGVARARVDWIFTMFRFHRREPGSAGLHAFHRANAESLASLAPELPAQLAALLPPTSAPAPDEERWRNGRRDPDRDSATSANGRTSENANANTDASVTRRGDDSVFERERDREAEYGRVLSAALSRLPG